ncbi:MAG TPA: DegT/DnrJ/EryC1/StrS family aminotransferase [Spirochaetales bacterium]|nr:DegT/DnrJ/EryC1/StrS family aminotransferase [Spirochaetales bacterium]
MDSVLSCLVTDSVGPGQVTEKYTKLAKEKLHFDAGVAFRTPYDALTFAFERLGLEQGARVGVGALAPFYHMLAIKKCGFQPVFIDYSLENCLPNMEQITSTGCSAFLNFEPFGILSDPAKLHSSTLPVIEDMSQALGARRAETEAGTLGDFVLYASENASAINTGGGALLFTRNKRNVAVLKSIADSLPPEVIMTDYNAALGLAQFKELDESLQRRLELESRFQQALARTRHKTFKQIDDGRSGLFAFPILLESGMNDVLVYAKKNGIECASAFETSIVAAEDFPTDACPEAHALLRRTVLFPLHQRISDREAAIIEKIIATLP